MSDQTNVTTKLMAIQVMMPRTSPRTLIAMSSSAAHQAEDRAGGAVGGAEYSGPAQ